MSSRRLGHSVTIAERHYVGLVSIPSEAHTLEQAMGVENLAEQIVAAVGKTAWRQRRAS